MAYLRKISFLWLLIFVGYDCIAQNYQHADSLKKALSIKKLQDTNSVKIYLNLSRIYTFNKPDSSLYYANAALLVSRQLKFDKGIMQSLCAKALPLSVLRSDSAAVSCAYDAIRIAENIKNKSWLAIANIALGSVYIQIHDYKKSILYHKKALTYLQQKNIYQFGTCLQHLAESYVGTKQTDSAFFYTEKTIDYFKRNNLKSPFNISLMGSVYFLKGDYDNALKYYKASLTLEANRTKKNTAGCYIGIARVFEQLEAPDSAIYYARIGFRVANTSDLPNDKLEILNLMTGLFESKHKIDSAFKYQKAALSLKDSIYTSDKMAQVQVIAFNDQMSKQAEIDEHNTLMSKIVISALIAALGFSFIIGVVIFKNSQYRKKSYATLQQQQTEIVSQKIKVEQALTDLKATQTQLIQSEKMASLGELTAGIAHEIQNPLNFVNNFSEVSVELLEELKQEAEAGNKEDVMAIADDLTMNLQKINHHGKRADFIVKGMLQHSRTSSGERQLTDINILADEFLKLSYHGLRAKDKNFNAELLTDFDAALPKVNIVQQDIGRVLLNLFNNALYAVNEKKKSAGRDYKPEVTVSTSAQKNHLIIKVKDNGPGIPDAIKDKIMQPFFTTKPTGEGTGLGLSLSYDIVVKGHGGKIGLAGNESEGSEFIIELPLSS